MMWQQAEEQHMYAERAQGTIWHSAAQCELRNDSYTDSVTLTEKGLVQVFRSLEDEGLVCFEEQAF